MEDAVEDELSNVLSHDPDPLEEIPGDMDLDRMLYPQDSPIISALYGPTLQEEITELQQSDSLISRQMGQWIDIQTRGLSDDREKKFYEGNRLDEIGI